MSGRVFQAFRALLRDNDVRSFSRPADSPSERVEAGPTKRFPKGLGVEHESTPLILGRFKQELRETSVPLPGLIK